MAALLFMALQIGNRIQEDLRIILEPTQCNVAVVAEKAPEFTSLMAMIQSPWRDAFQLCPVVTPRTAKTYWEFMFGFIADIASMIYWVGISSS